MGSDQKFSTGIDELFEAQSHIYKHMYHYMESMALKCAVQLQIPGIIHRHKKPITLFELAEQLNIPEAKTNPLKRVMRMLVHSGFFGAKKGESGHDDGYVLTPSSALLVENCNPKNLSSAVLTMLSPELVTPSFSLSEWLQKDDFAPTAFETYHGKKFSEYKKDDRESMNLFHGSMASDSEFVNLIVEEHKGIFEGISTLVEIGDKIGSLARKISGFYPCMQCTVLELSQVVMNMDIPRADAILMKSVLSNRSDEDSVKMLKRCREAIRGKLVIVEMVRNENKDENELEETKIFMDMEMMLLSGGKLRNEQEWKKLFFEVGFIGYEIIQTSGLYSIIQVYT